jgi:hypothetical protein
MGQVADHLVSREHPEEWEPRNACVAPVGKGSQLEKKPTDFGTREHQKVLYSIRYFSPSNLLKSIPLYRYNSQEANEPKY